MRVDSNPPASYENFFDVRHAGQQLYDKECVTIQLWTSPPRNLDKYGFSEFKPPETSLNVLLSEGYTGQALTPWCCLTPNVYLTYSILIVTSNTAGPLDTNTKQSICVYCLCFCSAVKTILWTSPSEVSTPVVWLIYKAGILLVVGPTSSTTSD